MIIIPEKIQDDRGQNKVASRLEAWKRLFQYDKRLLIWDIFISVLIGTIYTMIVIEPTNLRQAFLSSLTAESFVFHFIITARQQRDNNK